MTGGEVVLLRTDLEQLFPAVIQIFPFICSYQFASLRCDMLPRRHATPKTPHAADAITDRRSGEAVLSMGRVGKIVQVAIDDRAKQVRVSLVCRRVPQMLAQALRKLWTCINQE